MGPACYWTPDRRWHRSMLSIEMLGFPDDRRVVCLGDGLKLVGFPKPMILEGYNVEKGTLAALAAGSTGQGTLIGNFLDDAAAALGGTIVHWKPIQDVGCYHLRVHIAYP